ncbi:MAG: transposase [Desulfobacterales bacterium]
MLKKLRKEFDKEKLCFPGGTAQFAIKKRFEQLLVKAGNKKWVAYSKAPFGGPEQVLEYLGRYTHRVAISNNRILSIDNGKVTFTYRDRERNNEIKKMTLDADEFIRRFLLHVLPKGLVKIRYFGFLSHTNKNKEIPLIRKLIDPDATLPEKMKETIYEMMLRLTGTDITCCPKCMKGKMIKIRKLPKDDLN